MGAHRRDTDAEEREPHVGQRLAIRARGCGEPGDRIVAMAARQFGKADAHVGSGGGGADRGHHVARRERGLEQAPVKIIGLDGALAGWPRDHDLAAECDEAGRQLGRRIAERDRAADGAAVADRRMSDMRHRLGDERRVRGDVWRAFGLRVAHERAELEEAVAPRDAVEPGHAIDVDQEPRLAQPHIERRDQALPAGEDTRVGLAADERERVIERFRSRIGERRRLHAFLPALSLGALNTLTARLSCRCLSLRDTVNAADWCASLSPPELGSTRVRQYKRPSRIYPTWAGEGWGRGFGLIVRSKPLTPSLSHRTRVYPSSASKERPKSDTSDFGWQREHTESAPRPISNRLAYLRSSAQYRSRAASASSRLRACGRRRARTASRYRSGRAHGRAPAARRGTRRARRARSGRWRARRCAPPHRPGRRAPC